MGVHGRQQSRVVTAARPRSTSRPVLTASNLLKPWRLLNGAALADNAAKRNWDYAVNPFVGGATASVVTVTLAPGARFPAPSNATTWYVYCVSSSSPSSV